MVSRENVVNKIIHGSENFTKIIEKLFQKYYTLTNFSEKL